MIIAKSPEHVTTNLEMYGVNCHIFTILFQIK